MIVLNCLGNRCKKAIEPGFRNYRPECPSKCWSPDVYVVKIYQPCLPLTAGIALLVATGELRQGRRSPRMTTRSPHKQPVPLPTVSPIVTPLGRC